tara:strand:+ start:2853 stop:3095 length:243 start_codon:yes stop_codon:yes gene_type:complete
MHNSIRLALKRSLRQPIVKPLQEELEQRWDVVGEVFDVGEVCTDGCEWYRREECHLLETARTDPEWCPAYEDQLRLMEGE